MIKNNIQYTKAKKNLVNYDNIIKDEIKVLESKGTHIVEIEIKTNILHAQKEKLKLEIQEYEALLECNEIVIHNIYDLPKAIVKARLRTGCSQSELAKKIEVAEQQIQRYEAQDYNKANLERVIQIIDALDVKTSIVLKPRPETKVIRFKPTNVNANSLFERKKSIANKGALMIIGE